MSWGYKILIFYGLFVGMMAVLVIGSYQHKVNLVSKDYYEMELKYQDVIDGSKNYAAGQAAAEALVDGNTLLIQIPKSKEDALLTDLSVWFYNKVESEGDIRFEVKETKDNRLEIPLEEKHRGRYILKIQWKESGKPYYFEKSIDR